MAGERIKLEVQERESLGSRESRRLRKQGLIPGVLYGRGQTPHAICVRERELRRVLTGSHGLHTILDDPETVVATVTMPTRVVEPEPEEVEEGEVPEGEEAPEGAAEAPAESEADAAGESETAEG